jgi:hypothetical protein
LNFSPQPAIHKEDINFAEMPVYPIRLAILKIGRDPSQGIAQCDAFLISALSQLDPVNAANPALVLATRALAHLIFAVATPDFSKNSAANNENATSQSNRSAG